IDAAALARTLTAKVDGLRVLEDLTAGMALDAFVCFASIASVWGSAGQGSYAAANAFEDAWARARRARDLPALSVDWGPWAGGGGGGGVGRSGVVAARRRARRGPLTPGGAPGAVARARAGAGARGGVARRGGPGARAARRRRGPAGRGAAGAGAGLADGGAA